MESPTFYHTAVLLHESIDGLALKADGVYVDATLGGGGHARAILERLAPAGKLIAFDHDRDAWANAPDDPRVTLVKENFRYLRRFLRLHGQMEVDGILADLGVSSHQFDTGERGFSTRFDGPLDMRMDTTRGESAADFLARADLRHITEVIKNYGEERFALQVAKALVARREGGNPVRTTADLAGVVAGAVRTREAGQNPATRTFQALRIFVNAELEELEQALDASLDLLSPGGRLVVISFHSLEDRIVKTFIARESKPVVDRRAPFAEPLPMRLRSLARTRPGVGEVRDNPRSRSAVMRVAERTEAGAAGGAARVRTAMAGSAR